MSFLTIRGGRSGYGVVQQRHRKPVTPSTRCALMLAAPSRDWNVFTQIFAEHWDGFTHAHPHYQTAY